MTRTLRFALITAASLGPSLIPFAAGAQMPVAETVIVAGGMLPPNGSEGGLQSEASLPPGAMVGTDAWVTARIVNGYLASKESGRGPGALATR